MRFFEGIAAALLVSVPGMFAQSPVLGADPGAGQVAAQLVVSGIVQMESSKSDVPLPQDLRIFVDCHHGDFFDGGGTTQSGAFRFTMKPDPMAIAAANICALEAKAFGYESTVARFPVRSGSGLVDIGMITLSRSASGDMQDQNKERGPKTVSATSLQAPPAAVKLFDQGSRSLQQTKYAAAAKDFESAIKIYPQYAEAWLNLGRARISLKQTAQARDAFLKAGEIDPQMPGPPEELGLLAAAQNDVVTAAKYLDESLRLDPASSYRACYSDAVVNMMLKRYDAAERAARAALEFGDSPAQAKAHYLLAMALLTKGANPEEAKRELERYLELAPQAPEKAQIEAQLVRMGQAAK